VENGKNGKKIGRIISAHASKMKTSIPALAAIRHSPAFDLQGVYVLALHSLALPLPRGQ